MLATASNHKAGRGIRLPHRIPFEHLDLRKQRNIIKSLCRFEIVKAGQSPKRVSRKSLKRFMDGSYIQIRMASEKLSPHSTFRSKKSSPQKNSSIMSSQINGKKINFKMI